jgi:hypothetical protein
MSPNRASGPDHSSYGPGTVGRFTFMVTAPAVTEPMMVTDHFGLVEEGVTWFGPEDIRIEIMVRPPEGVPTDVDGDGFFAASDCDDTDPERHPGATDPCGDGLDADCDGEDACVPGPGGDDPEIPIVPGGPGGDDPMRRPGGVSGGCATTGAADLPPLALVLILALIAVPRRRC